MRCMPFIAIVLVAALPAPCFARTVPTARPPVSSRQIAGPSKIFVGAGTGVPVHVVGSLSSGTARPDDVFEIEVADDVAVGGVIVFRKGAGGQGHVVESDSAAGNGHSGALSLVFDYVYAVDGGRVKLSAVPQSEREDDRKGASSTATIIGFATFGIGGLFGHNLARGRQKTIDEHAILRAFTSDDVHIVSTERALADRYDD